MASRAVYYPTLSESPKTGFLAKKLNLYVVIMVFRYHLHTLAPGLTSFSTIFQSYSDGVWLRQAQFYSSEK